MFQNLLAGFANVLTPLNLLMLFSAIVLGFFGGAMPGISGITLIVILLPVTYGMDPIPVFVLLTAIYCATAYSGSVSAILYRIPGTPESVVTTFDGYALAQKGKAGEALGLAMTSSAFGGIVGAIFLFFLTQPLTKLALKFSSPEYFAMAVMGLSMVATLSAKDLLKGLLSALLGLFLATIGIDAVSGVSRFTFHSTNLLLGVSPVPMMTGLFGISEILKNAKRGVNLKELTQNGKIKAKLFQLDVLKRSLRTMIYGSLIGTVIGVLPGVGGTTAAIVSYSENMRISKHPEEFGTGCPEGVAAPESANNSAATTSLVPLFSLGIPGSATAAVILGVFIIHGLQPGPLMLTKQPALVYTVFAGLFLVNVMMLLLAKPFIRAFVHTQDVPYSILAPLIILFCFIGAYTVRNSLFDIWVMLFFGLMGYYFDRIKFPLAPIILGIVLGPMAEEELRRSLIMSSGKISIFFTRPISLILLLIAAASFLYALYKSFKKPKKAK
jgi:putative tricarboxylic transport membrane protein